MSAVAAPVYSEKINVRLPDGLDTMFLLSANMLFYPLSLTFCNSELNHIIMCYVLH